MVRAVIRVPGYSDDGQPGPSSFGASSGRRGPMGKVPSLVFEMEDDDAAAGHAHGECMDEGEIAGVAQSLHALLEPWSEAEYMLLLHVRLAREEASKRGCVNALPDLADMLRRLGYVVKIRTALGGGGGASCLRNLRHSFLTCAIQGPSGEIMEYVVDPRFREQFEIAQQTNRYSRVLAALGPEVVATPDRLNKVVDLLCTEVARAFAETNTPLPPWRQHAAMLSKWQPRRSEEVEVSAAMLNGEAGLRRAIDALRGGRRKVAPVTGPATIAQRLAMLGVQQPSRVSPVAEGMELGADVPPPSVRGNLGPACGVHAGPGDGSDRGSDSGSEHAGEESRSQSSDDSDSLHLDTPEEEEEGGPAACGLAGMETDGQPPLHLRKAVSGAVPSLLQAGDGARGVPLERSSAQAKPNSKPSHIWQGIKSAVAALPQRRNTWA